MRIYRLAQSRLTHFRTHFCLAVGWGGGIGRGQSLHIEKDICHAISKPVRRQRIGVEYVACLWAAKRICMYPVSRRLQDRQNLRSGIAPVRILQRMDMQEPSTYNVLFGKNLRPQIKKSLRRGFDNTRCRKGRRPSSRSYIKS